MPGMNRNLACLHFPILLFSFFLVFLIFLVRIIVRIKVKHKYEKWTAPFFSS